MDEHATRLRAALADRYLIERELGRGGMATVCLAEDTKLERHVAVKVLKAELAAVLGKERFFREVKITAKLGTLLGRGDSFGHARARQVLARGLGAAGPEKA